jgi:hypothetical protein
VISDTCLHHDPHWSQHQHQRPHWSQHPHQRPHWSQHQHQRSLLCEQVARPVPDQHLSAYPSAPRLSLYPRISYAPSTQAAFMTAVFCMFLHPSPHFQHIPAFQRTGRWGCQAARGGSKVPTGEVEQRYCTLDCPLGCSLDCPLDCRCCCHCHCRLLGAAATASVACLLLPLPLLPRTCCCYCCYCCYCCCCCCLALWH